MMPTALDMRTYIDVLEEMGEIRRLSGVDLDLEVGALNELVGEQEGQALLFDQFADYPGGYRVICNLFRTCRRTAVAMGLPIDLKGTDFIAAWRERFRQFKPLPALRVESGPVFENQVEESDIDLARFPTPKWHELDGGAYIGTGCAVVTQDPDSQKINVGTYRMMVQGKNKVSVKMNLGKHGRLMLEKSHARGKALPVAVSLGQEPALFIAAQMPVSPEVDEYQFAGWLQNSPIPVVRGALTGLPIPANSEVVLEGEIPPDRIQRIAEGRAVRRMDRLFYRCDGWRGSADDRQTHLSS